MKIKVKQKHITTAQKKLWENKCPDFRRANCPVALALKDELAGSLVAVDVGAFCMKLVLVQPQLWRWGKPIIELSKTLVKIGVPKAVSRRITGFDTAGKMQPFEFEFNAPHPAIDPVLFTERYYVKKRRGEYAWELGYFGNGKVGVWTPIGIYTNEDEANYHLAEMNGEG